MKLILNILLFLFILCHFSQGQQAAYRFKPNKEYKYVTESKSDVVTEMIGQTMNSKTETYVITVFSISKVFDNGDMAGTMKITSAQILTSGDRGQQSISNELT